MGFVTFIRELEYFWWILDAPSPNAVPHHVTHLTTSVFISLLARLCMVARIGFLAMNRAKTFKDESDESERPTAILGETFIIIAVVLFIVDWMWL